MTLSEKVVVTKQRVVTQNIYTEKIRSNDIDNFSKVDRKSLDMIDVLPLKVRQGGKWSNKQCHQKLFNS